MAHLPAHLPNAAPKRRCGTESNAGTAATLHHPGDLGYVHPGGYGGETRGAERGGLASCWKRRLEAVRDTSPSDPAPGPGLRS